MKIKTSELIGPTLDWAVAKCESLVLDDDVFGLKPIIAALVFVERFKPSTDWSQGGPIIERELISTLYVGEYDGGWQADISQEAEVFIPSVEARQYGPTPLIAAMRCFVASKLGDEIEIPEELS